jgi:hypothetical protein
MDTKYIVPGDLADDGAAIVDLLREAARSQGKDADVALLGRGSSRGFEPGTLSTSVLLIGGSASTWLTKHWIDTYLWPLVQQRIDRPSRKFVDWLGTKLPGGNAGSETAGR